MKKYFKIIFLIIWIIFIFYNSLQNGVKSNEASGTFVNLIYNLFNSLKININVNTLSIIIRKSAHVIEFLILGILIYINLKDNIKGKYFYLYLILLPIVIAILDESIQTFIDGRSGNFIDVLIDSFGSMLGIYIIILITKLLNKKKKIT